MTQTQNCVDNASNIPQYLGLREIPILEIGQLFAIRALGYDLARDNRSRRKVHPMNKAKKKKNHQPSARRYLARPESSYGLSREALSRGFFVALPRWLDARTP